MNLDTRSVLLQKAARHLRKQGYAAFSFADLARECGISKASVHHHFPTKEALGAAVFVNHQQQMAARLQAILDDHPMPRARLIAYAGLFREGFSEGLLPLCGALAAERDALPPSLRNCAADLFTLELDWLQEVLKDTPSPRRAAIALLCALEGGAFVSWGLSDLDIGPSAFDDALASILPDDL